MKRIQLFICLIVVVLACDVATGKEVTVPEISRLTEIVVRTNGVGQPITKRISDPSQIKKIVLFLNREGGGWDKPWYGIPVGSLMLELYDGKDFRGEFSIGDNFFETQRNGSFWSKDATKEKRKERLKLLDLPKEKR